MRFHPKNIFFVSIIPISYQECKISFASSALIVYHYFILTVIRLVNPYNFLRSGRVEVLHNDTWLTVCSYYYYWNWNLRNANVVCRQLGYDGALLATYYAEFGRRTGQAWLKYLDCRGNETLVSQCPLGWRTHRCWDYYNAGVVCRPAGRTAIKLYSTLIKN